MELWRVSRFLIIVKLTNQVTGLPEIIKAASAMQISPPLSRVLQNLRRVPSKLGVSQVSFVSSKLWALSKQGVGAPVQYE